MKKLILGIGLFFVVLLALALTLPFLIDLTHFKDRFLPQVEAALNRKVDVRKIRLSLIPLGARVEGVTVLDDPAFSNDPFLTIESTVVHLKFFPLLQRRLEVSEFSLKRPEMVLIKNSEGVMNTSTLGKKSSGEKSPAPAPAAPSAPASQVGIQGEEVTVKGGKVTLIDLSAPEISPFVAENMAVNVKNLILGQTPSFDASARLMPADKMVKLKGEIGPLTTQMKPEQVHLAANIGESDLDLRGGFQGDRAEMKARSKMLNLDELMALLPASSSDTTKPPQKGPAPAPSPGAARASLDFNFDKVVTQGIEIKEVVGRVGLHRGLFSLEQFSASLFEGKLSGNARVNTASATYPFTSELSLQGVSFGALAEKLVSAPSGLLTGKSNLSVSLRGEGSDWSQLSKSLTGQGALSVQNGGIEKVNLLKQTFEALHAAGIPNISQAPRTTFSEMKTALTVDRGRIRLPDLKVAASEFTFLGEGTVGVNGEFQIGGAMKLSPSLTAQIQKGPLASLLGGKKGEAVFPIQLAGNTQGVRLAVDETALKKQATERFTERLEKEKGAVIEKFFKR